MRITVLHNRDAAGLEVDPGREAREEVVQVARALAEVLVAGGHSVDVVSVEADVLSALQHVRRSTPDVVVNLCESIAGDSRGESLIPAFLDVLGIAYTGSSASALFLALHKNRAKEVLRARGVPTPASCVVERVEQLLEVDLPFPLIVKPVREDASVGIDFESVVNTKAALGRAVTRVLRTFKQPALVEQYIDGREIYVPLFGNLDRRALPLSEVHFGRAFDGKPRILSYTAKWETDSALCIESPTQLISSKDDDMLDRCIGVARAAFDALECRDYGRVDLRVDSNGQPYVIDINPNCDLHPQAGFARAALSAGIGYSDLAFHLVELALERRHGNQTTHPAGSTAARRALGPHRDLLGGRTAMRARAYRRRSSAEQS